MWSPRSSNHADVDPGSIDVSTVARSAEDRSVWDDIVGVLYRPHVVLRRPPVHVAILFLCLCLVLMLFTFTVEKLFANAIAADRARMMQEAMKQVPGLSADQFHEAEQRTAPLRLAGSLIAVPAAVLLMGTMIWGMIRIAGSRASFSVALFVTVLSYVPLVLRDVLIIGQGLTVDALTERVPSTLSIGISRLIDPTTLSPAIRQLADRSDAFVLWAAILIMIGAWEQIKLSPARAALVGAGYWVLPVLPALLGSLW